MNHTKTEHIRRIVGIFQRNKEMPAPLFPCGLIISTEGLATGRVAVCRIFADLFRAINCWRTMAETRRTLAGNRGTRVIIYVPYSTRKRWSIGAPLGISTEVSFESTVTRGALLQATTSKGFDGQALTPVAGRLGLFPGTSRRVTSIRTQRGV